MWKPVIDFKSGISGTALFHHNITGRDNIAVLDNYTALKLVTPTSMIMPYHIPHHTACKLLLYNLSYNPTRSASSPNARPLSRSHSRGLAGESVLGVLYRIMQLLSSLLPERAMRYGA
jgi:hypothetical protein